MQLNLSHSTQPYEGFALFGLGIVVTARMYSTEAAFTDLMLKVSNITITNRTRYLEGTVAMTVPASEDNVDEINDRVGGRIEVKVYNQQSDGTLYCIQIIDSAVTSYNYAIATDGGVFNLGLLNNFRTPTGYSVVVDNYVSKKRTTYTEPELNTNGVFVFSLNPVDYRYYSVDADFTDGDVVGLITEIVLKLAIGNIELLVEVTE